MDRYAAAVTSLHDALVACESLERRLLRVADTATATALADLLSSAGPGRRVALDRPGLAGAA